VIKSFFISHDLPPQLLSRAAKHNLALANRYGFRLEQHSSHGFTVQLILDGDPEEFIQNEIFSFTLGQVDEHPASWDRFLKISLSKQGLTLESDYAGSIPVFFSHRHGLTLSNIEPSVFLATDSSLADLSYENLYGFLRYSHFIWDETAWSHIQQMLPDSKYFFSPEGELKRKEYLGSVQVTDSRHQLSDGQVADAFFELNRDLVYRSLGDSSEIILPLSSGYDSRLIYAALADNPDLISKTRCFTYGPTGSIEAESARRLTSLSGVEWHQVDLPCRFLEKPRLEQVADIFGASLHMHGMYQFEFHDQIRTRYKISPEATFTSGFMTGVPAGQHNGLMDIGSANCRLTAIMDRFSQSKAWPDAQLEELPMFSGKNYIDLAEERFRASFDLFDGDLHHKSIMFDVWTRQRNFISYYPRVFEWLGQIASPHMSPDYTNFFMSLSKEHLHNRRAVELMLLKHYPKYAAVASNSNGFSALGNPAETALLFLSRIINVLGISNPLPVSLHNKAIDFDTTAIGHCLEDAYFPLFSDSSSAADLVDSFGGRPFIRDLYEKSLAGDLQSYARALPLQAIALNLAMADNV